MGLPPLFVSVTILIFMVVWGVPGIRYMLKKQRSKRWPVVSGTLQTGWTQRPDPWRLFFRFPYYSVLNYEYEVGEQKFVGQFILGTADQWTANSLQELARGQHVSVRYDPLHPEDSLVLENDILGREIQKRLIRLM
jgi:hypothetical protein